MERRHRTRSHVSRERLRAMPTKYIRFATCEPITHGLVHFVEIGLIRIIAAYEGTVIETDER